MRSIDKQMEKVITYAYGPNSLAMKAYDLVINEMSAKKGFTRWDGSDYYHHCIDVALFIFNNGIRDMNIICGALLHDIIEDVKGWDFNRVESEFNTTIAEYVFDCSKTDEVTLEEFLDNISKNFGSSIIKAGDRVMNFATIGGATTNKRHKKAVETETYYIPFFKKCRNKYPRYADYFYLCKMHIEPHIIEIKSCFEEIEELKKEIKKI